MNALPPVLVPHPHVIVSPDVLNGSPFVEGSRVPVRRIWAWFNRGVTVEVLIKRYPQLGPSKVMDALAFAFDNTALIEADLKRERELLAPGPFEVIQSELFPLSKDK